MVEDIAMLRVLNSCNMYIDKICCTFLVVIYVKGEYFVAISCNLMKLLCWRHRESLMFHKFWKDVPCNPELKIVFCIKVLKLIVRTRF